MDQAKTLTIQLNTGGPRLNLLLQRTDTMAEVARQVRASQGWDVHQHMRFISSGQELHMDDSVARALGSVLHCIACQAPTHKYPAAKSGPGSKGHAVGVDWLEVVDPGTVLMLIFGSILALLWLLFVCYAHMFDKTSVVMLCMMTIAFLIPCVLSYVPALRVLQAAGPGLGPQPRHSSSGDGSAMAVAARPGGAPAAPLAAAAGGTAWQQHGSARGSYTGAIPPRPLAPRARPRPAAS